MEELKYKFFWLIGTAFSMIGYFSGIVSLYVLFRRNVLGRGRTVVLTYHRIRDDGKDSNLAVSPDRFESQIRYLKEKFSVVGLDAIACPEKSDPPKSMDRVSITFDDGYRDNFQNAYPILRKHDVPATVFLVSSWINNKEEMLNKHEIQTMSEGGIEFGSHTATHPILSEINVDAAREEISSSKSTLEKLLGRKVSFFAYPKGKRRHFNRESKTQVKRSGYVAAFTTENKEIHYCSDLFELGRLGIRNCPLFVFKVRLSGIFESRIARFAREVLKLT